jgi:hypothetical protein
LGQLDGPQALHAVLPQQALQDGPQRPDTVNARLGPQVQLEDGP